MQQLNAEYNKLNFIFSFVRSKYFLKGIDSTLLLYKELALKKFTNKALGRFLIPLPLTKHIFDFIEKQNDEVKKEYWTNISVNFYGLDAEYKIIGLKYLIEYKRYFSAIETCSFTEEDIPGELIFDILIKAATEKSEEPANFESYHIGLLFDKIYNSNAIAHEKLIQLEWLYLPILASYGSGRDPKILHDELTNNPSFFVDVLRYIFHSKNKEILEDEHKGLSDDLIRNRGHQAYRLLETWKTIPGMSENGTIDNLTLTSWVQSVREQAESVGRLDVADMQIGKMLAQYPEKNEI